MAELVSDSIDGHLTEVGRALVGFREKFAISFIISISGGAEERNFSYVLKAINELVDGLANHNYAILTGGTEGGIPEMGTKIAREKGVPTIGIFPPKGRKYALLNDLDLAIETLPSSIGQASFGAESYSFSHVPDYAVFIGGSNGTLIEYGSMMKINAKRRKESQKPINILPLTGSGGVADLIPMLVQQLSPELAYCLPSVKIVSGSQIAKYIRSDQKK